MPRRTEPKRVSVALAERTGFDRFVYTIGPTTICWQPVILSLVIQLLLEQSNHNT